MRPRTGLFSKTELRNIVQQLRISGNLMTYIHVGAKRQTSPKNQKKAFFSFELHF